MPDDLLDQIREINPLPDDLEAPALASLPALRELEARPRARRRTRSTRTTLLKRGAIALPVAGIVLGLALLGQGGAGQFDVAAAVYEATTAGNGIHYMLLEADAEGGSRHIRYQRWSTTDPLRERSVQTEGSRTVVELVDAGRYDFAWATAHANKVYRTDRAERVSTWDPVRAIQRAYRAGQLRVLGKIELGARAAYRTQILPIAGASGTVIVDAHTFMPIEMIYRGHDAPASAPPILVIHVRSYKQLPVTKANLALLGVAHHPGARVVEVARQSPR